MSGIAVLGAGAFGTALAVVLGREQEISLWARDKSVVDDINATGRNPRHLSSVSLPDGLRATHEIPSDASAMLLAIPTQKLAGFLTDNADHLADRTLVICCKGIDQSSGLRPSELLARNVPSASVAVLTGPSFAIDIAEGRPTALTLATTRGGPELQAALSCPTLRLYLTDDVVGAELGGALKNVMALAAGLTIGAGLAESARAAVITRGFAELSRFAAAFGARPETLHGLSGLGDLILTATSEKSRNYRAGKAIAGGHGLPEGTTIEGLATARSVAALAAEAGIEMPLTLTVAAVTEGKMTVPDAVAALMSRPLKEE